MNSQVIKNKYGFYELKNKPTEEEIEKYYVNKYYQEDIGPYPNSYSESQLKYIEKSYERKNKIIIELIKQNKKPLNFLDIGCGEGWTLDFFLRKGWNVKGIDYSDIGIKKHNKAILPYFLMGDIYDELDKFIINNEQFDIIWLDNVLEHVLEPKLLLEKVNKVMSKNAILVIEVPNDFSSVQNYLVEIEKIEEPFWIVEPDHISYFNLEGLKNLCRDTNLELQKSISDFPVDLNLFNECTNYVKNKNLGKYVHEAKLEIETFLSNLNEEKLSEIYMLYSEIGIGRNITGFFKKVY